MRPFYARTSTEAPALPASAPRSTAPGSAPERRAPRGSRLWLIVANVAHAEGTLLDRYHVRIAPNGSTAAP